MKSKPLFAAIVFLAGSTACSDADHALPQQAAEQASDNSPSRFAGSASLSPATQRPADLLHTPTMSQQQTAPPLYAMNERTPPRDVLVWKHDWEFVQGPSGDDSTLFGASINAIGDVNGDGYDDFAAGGWEYDVDVYVFHGSSGVVNDTPNLQISTPQPGSHFGYTIAAAGDVNGDGYDDVIIGAPSYSPSRDGSGGGGQDAGDGADADENPPTEGAAYLFMGGANGLDSSPAATWIGDDPASQLGYAVDGAGDVNRDGYDDVLIGAPFSPGASGAPQSGEVRLYHGSGSGVSDTTEPVRLDAPENGIAYGYSVSGVGDTDGDGFDDILIGAIGFSDGEQFEGGAFAYLGSQDGLSDTPDWQAAGANVQQAFFGFRLDSAGDVNNDGFNDVVIGAPYYSSDPDDENQVAEGAVFVYMGSEDGLEADPEWMVESDRREGFLGSDVSGGFDVNGDGFDDILIADAHHGLVSYGGELYLGSEDGLKDEFDWQAIYEGSSTIGDTARFAGDVNGDGYGDILLGGPYYASIYLYYGAPCFDADWDGYKGYNPTTCELGDDCHDLHDSAYPGAEEICDDLDNDCDGDFDTGCDDDGDGFCDADMGAWAAGGPPAVCPNGFEDCDDEDPDHNPDSPELCNFIDDDCNDKIDEEPKVCGAEQICVQGSCFSECTDDAQCADGEGCYDGRCAADPCAGIECPERGEECFMGTCQVTCEMEAECRWDDKQCVDGRCANDPCDGVICRTSEVCDDGQCVNIDGNDDEGGGSGDAGDADAGGEDTGSTGQPSNNDSSDGGGCSAAPGGVPSTGVMLMLAALGGLFWRRRQ